jgi:hypothetical protein
MRIRIIGTFALAAAWGFPALLGTASSAHAAAAPNYARYCATHHRGSIVGYNRATREPLCTLRTRNSMLHYRVNVGEACRLTTGSRAFRRMGAGRYLCLGQAGRPQPPATTGRAPDYARYCRTYHRGGFVTFTKGMRDPQCTLRTSRYSLRHYRIPVAEACRLTTGSRAFRRVAVGRYVCLGRGRPAPAPRATGVTPNYARYCATFHRGSFANVNRVTREHICTLRTSQYRVLHYRINYAGACRLTTGSTRFRRYGPGVVRCF